MSVEAYYIIPVPQMEKMEQQLHHQKRTKEESEKKNPDKLESDKILSSNYESKLDNNVEEKRSLTPPTSRSSPVLDDSVEAKLQPPLSPEVKELAKSKRLVNAHFEKFLQAVQKYKGGELNLPKLDIYIKQALGKSRKYIEGEAEFYNFLLEHNLFSFVRNPHKISMYYKNWFRIG